MRAAPRDRGDETGAVQGERQSEVVFGVGQRGQAEARARGVLQVRAHVCDVADAHFCGGCPGGGLGSLGGEKVGVYRFEVWKKVNRAIELSSSGLEKSSRYAPGSGLRGEENLAG